jgi:hypothetical protein
MDRMLWRILVLLLGLSPVAAGDERSSKPSTAAEQYLAIAKEFNGEGYALRQAKTDDERERVVIRVEKLTLRLLDLAEKNPKDPAAMDALVQAVTQEIWMENNSSHPGRGQESPEVRAIAILLRDHVRSDRAGEACRRMSYGFRKECETFLRSVFESNPHRDVRALSCLRLAQFLNGRLQRLELLKERPELAKRYEGLFGKDYLQALQQKDRAQAVKEVEAVFEHAAHKYGDVKLPFGGTVGEKANAELHEIRHLAVGRAAQDIEGDDQDGKRFKLSDYRGKVVLLYFWSEY